MTSHRWVAGLVAAALGGVPSSVLAHGGVEASAFVRDPDVPGVVVDDRFEFRWWDASDVQAATASTTHSFHYTTFLPPPWPVFLAPAGLEGTAIVEGVPEADPENAHTWDTSRVEAGAYWIWSIASDPDLFIPSQSIVFSPYPVVVAHPGDPVPPFATLETPDSPAAIAVNERYRVRYVVFDPDSSGQLTLERALEDPAGNLPTGFEPVVVELPPTSGEVEVDTSSWPEGFHILRISLRDGRGLSFSSFARHPLLVPERTVDAPDAGSPDTGVSGPDGGSSNPVDPPDSTGCECMQTEARLPARGAAFILLVFPLLLLKTRSARRA